MLTGYFVGQPAGVDDLFVTLASPGMPPRDLSLELVRCGRHEGCLVQVRLGELPPNTAFDVIIGGPFGEPDTFSYVTSASFDERPPIVPALTLADTSVQAAESGGVERSVTLHPSVATDDTAVSGYALFVAAPGDPAFSLVDRHEGADPPLAVTHLVPEEAAAGEACYLWAAWDWSGNEGLSAGLCVDVTVSDEEAAPFRTLCSSTDVSRRAPYASLVFVVGLLGLAVRRPRNVSRAEPAGERRGAR